MGVGATVAVHLMFPGHGLILRKIVGVRIFQRHTLREVFDRHCLHFSCLLDIALLFFQINISPTIGRAF